MMIDKYLTLIISIVLPVFLTFLLKYLGQVVYGTALEKHLQSNTAKLGALLVNRGFPIIFLSFLLAIVIFIPGLNTVPVISNLRITPHFSVQDTNKVFSISSVGKYPINSVDVSGDSKRIQPYSINYDNGDYYYLVPNSAKYITFDSKVRWKISDLRYKRLNNITEAKLENENGRYLKSLQVNNSFIDVNKIDGAKYLNATVENTVKVPTFNEISKNQLTEFLSYSALAMYFVLLVALYFFVWRITFKDTNINEFIVKSDDKSYEILKTIHGDKVLLEAKQISNSMSEYEVRGKVTKEYKLLPMSDLNNILLDNDGIIFGREISYSYKDRLSTRLYDEYLNRKFMFILNTAIFLILDIILVLSTIYLCVNFIQKHFSKFKGISYFTYENLVIYIFALCICIFATLGLVAIFIKLSMLFKNGSRKRRIKKEKE